METKLWNWGEIAFSINLVDNWKLTIVAKVNKPLTTLYCLVPLIFCLQISSRSSFQLTILITARLDVQARKKVTTELRKQLFMSFFVFVFVRVRHWCPCRPRFNSSWEDFLNIHLQFHLKSSIPSWLHKFLSSFEHINYAENEKIHIFD